jgi:hypothetical protein
LKCRAVWRGVSAIRLVVGIFNVTIALCENTLSCDLFGESYDCDCWSIAASDRNDNSAMNCLNPGLV